MDRSLAVARPVPAQSHLRLASDAGPELADANGIDTGDGPTRLFSPDPSYRGPGTAPSSAMSSVSEPALRAPAGGYLEVDEDDVAEVLEGRLDLVIDTNPSASASGRGNTAVMSQPMHARAPESIDRTQISTPAVTGGTQPNARPVMRTPDASGTQIVERPVMRTPDRSGTQIVDNPVMRMPEPVIPDAIPHVVVPPLGVPMPIAAPAPLALDRTELSSRAPGPQGRPMQVVAARLVVAGHYLTGGDDVSEQTHAVGTSFVLTRTPTSAFCDDPYVDSQHGAMTFRPDGVAIDDFDSTNGVFVRVHGRVSLRSDDMFRAGEELLRYTALKSSRAAGRAPALGSPDPGYWGRIDVMISLEANAASYPIDDVEVSFGQTDGHLQFPDDPYLGELHCRVVKDERGAVLEDLGSPCGTWLRLRSGDVVPYGAELLVGQTRIRIERE